MAPLTHLFLPHYPPGIPASMGNTKLLDIEPSHCPTGEPASDQSLYVHTRTSV